jgi:DNA-directed RNA polymerase specialized sigma24 family protein
VSQEAMKDPQVAGASEWLRSIVDGYEGPLIRYAAHIMGDMESARDVVQDTFLRLCEQDRQQLDGHLAECARMLGWHFRGASSARTKGGAGSRSARFGAEQFVPVGARTHAHQSDA